jgi:hypothetical protein
LNLALDPSPAAWPDIAYVSVNGVSRPSLALRVGEWRVLRVLNAATDLEVRPRPPAAARASVPTAARACGV